MSRTTSAPLVANADLECINDFVGRLDQQEMPLDTLLISKHGSVVLDQSRWPHRSDRPRMLHSATKSFVGVATGLAIDEGRLSLGDHVVDFFPERSVATDDPIRSLTIEHLLTMRTGHAVGPSGATWRRLRTSWIDEYFALPMVEAPGQHFIYSSATSHMLSAVLQRVTGVTTHEYLGPRLFEPLGFQGHRWSTDPEGISSGGNGLSIRPVDFLNWGRMLADGGRWHGAQIVPTSWVDASTWPHTVDASLRWNGTGFEHASASDFADRAPQGYGYHLWTTTEGMFFASGIFGQLCLVSPRDGVIIVATGSLPDELGATLLTEIVTHLLPTIRQRDISMTPAPSTDGWSTPDVLSAESVIKNVDAEFLCEPNEDGLSEFRLKTVSTPHGAEIRAELVDDRGTHVVRSGLGRWVESRSSVTSWPLHHSYQSDDALIVAGAEWLSRTTLTLRWNFVESPFRDVITVQWASDDEVHILRGTNVNSGTTARPPIIARRQHRPRS